MNDDEKTKEQLIEELNDLRQQTVLNRSKDIGNGRAQQFAESDFYRLATEHSDEGIIILSADKRLFFNKSYLELAGYNTLEEIDKIPYLSVVHPDDRQRVKEIIRQRQAGKPAPSRYECKFLRPDGSIIHVEISSSLITYRGQLASLGYVRDISDHKRVEDSLSMAQREWENIFQAIGQPAVIIDPQRGVIAANRAVLHASGMPLKDILGKKCYQIFHSKSSKTHPDDCPMAKLIRTGQMETVEMEMEAFGGVFLVSCTPVLDDHGRLEKVIHIATDITQRQQMEKALHESEFAQRSILLAAPVGIGLVSDRIIKRVNTRLCNMLDYRSEELIGQSARIFYPTDEEFELVGKEKYAQISKWGTGTVETRWIRKNGTIINILLSSTPLDPADLAKGVTFTALDITERNRVQEELRESQRRLLEIIEFLPDATLVIDRDGKVITWNRATEAMTGIKAEQMLGKGNHEYALPFYGDRRPILIDLALHPNSEMELAYTNIQKRGDILFGEAFTPNLPGGVAHLSATASVLHDSKGEIIAAIECIRDNTKPKWMQNALQKSEEKYRSIFENASEGIFQSTPEGRFISVNPAMARMCGYDSPEAMLAEITDIAKQHYVYPEEREIFKRMMAEQGYVENFEHEAFRRDGSTFWVSVNARAVHENDGSILFYEGRHQDITRRKEVEEALRESEERYRTILEEIEEGYQEVDLYGNFTFFNESFRKIFGYTRDELLGKNYRIFAADEENIKNVYRVYNRMFKTGLPIRGVEWEVIRKDGDKRSIEFFASVVRDTEGRPTGFRGIARDITARKHTEEQYQTVANKSQVGVYIIQDGGFCFVNPHILRYSGYLKEELIGAMSLNFVHPDDREMVREQARKMLKGETTSPYEYRIIDQNKQIKWLMETVTLITHRGRQAILGNTMDITKQKELEADRRRLESQLLQAQKMEAVGTLAGGIAHDFNNLLMGIQGYASLMLLNINPSHPHYEKLKRIEEQVQSGADLTKQLLGFARGGRYEIKPTNLNEVIRKTSGLFSRTKREITIHSKYERHPWPVEIDQGQIEQVLLNLYVNAWQAMPGGGEIYLETENVHLDENATTAFSIKPGRYVKASITDTGVGMDEKTKERIFEPFFTTKEMGRGTGLGLAMVYGIIKGHKGIINVYSEKGHGTTFSIYLPASRKEVIKEERPSEKIQMGRETILLVDDEKIITEVTREMLEGLGYQVLTAQSGHEAIEIYRANREKIDLVILDMIMPGMGGGETFDLIKSINPGVKAILSSGYSINGLAKTIMERGVQSFLQKPFRIKELSQKIRDVLGNAENPSGKESN